MPSDHRHSLDDLSFDGETRRDSLYLATGTLGAALALWPLIDIKNPTADVLVPATTDIGPAPTAPGQRITVRRHGRPVFIDRARRSELPGRGPTTPRGCPTRSRTPPLCSRPTRLIVVGICMRLGQRVGSLLGEHGGRSPDVFLDDTTVRIG